MISRVRFDEFRALRNVDVDLHPLTVLIGPNDTGKSSFLDWINQNVPTHDFSIQGTRPATWRLFRLPALGPKMSSPGASESLEGTAPPLATAGDNIPAILDALYRRDPQRYERIVNALRTLVPGLKRVEIYTPKAADRAILVALDDDQRITGEELSAGVKLLFFFTTLIHHPEPPELIMIEEPENGVHPKRLGEIVEMLRGLTTGAMGGRPSQVILSTHSPYLLDHVTPPDDQVIVFRRDADGSRSATEVDTERLKLFLDEFMLGEVWFNQGEEGLIPKTA